jgi:hypothetical protein
MEINIKAAAEMVKVSRTTIYEKIKSGELSKSANGKIDTSELLRVFGSPADRRTRQEEKEHIEHLKSTLNTEQKEQTVQHTLNTEKEDLYKSQIRILEDALQQANKREEWQRQHIEKLVDTIKLLEPPKPQIPEKPKGFFRRLFTK